MRSRDDDGHDSRTAQPAGTSASFAERRARAGERDVARAELGMAVS